MPLTPITNGMSGADARTSINECFTKVDTVETGAQVTDLTNVQAALTGATVTGLASISSEAFYCYNAAGTLATIITPNAIGLADDIGSNYVSVSVVNLGTARALQIGVGGVILTDASSLAAANLTGTIANARLPTTMSGLTSVSSTIFVGALTGAASLNLLLTGGTLTGAVINSTNGAVSAPVLSLTGTTFSGGTATTTKPTLLIEPAGTTSTSWSTSGTLIGGNAANGFTGNLIDVKFNNLSVFKVGYNSTLAQSVVELPTSSIGGIILGGDGRIAFGYSGNNLYVGSATVNAALFSGTAAGALQFRSDYRLGWVSGTVLDQGIILSLVMSMETPAVLRMGYNAATGTPVAQTIKAPNGTAGQTNQPGGNLTISSGLSTGNGAASVIIATSDNTAGSTVLNSAVTRLTANASGVQIASALTVGTTLGVTGTTTVTGGIIYGTFTVGTFPSTTYLEAIVTDALAPVQGATVANGGSAKCKVMYNGSANIVTAVL